MPRLRAFLATAALVAAPAIAAVPAQAHPRATDHRPPPAVEALRSFATHRLTPRTRFHLEPDGSSGLRPRGDAIPNIDSVKATIRTYYNATDGIADKQASPYITQMTRLLDRRGDRLKALYRATLRHGHGRPAIVLDADDTTLWTYDMEDAAMHFTFDPALQDVWVQEQRFPATPGMVRFVRRAERAGFAIFGLTGRNAAQETATLGNLDKVGYRAFDADNFYTKFVSGTPVPDYLDCAAVTSCTTVEYKAGTRRHIESLGYDIALNVGDQWSDLMGGAADHVLKLPNPTYYLPSPNLPGVDQPRMAPRTHFRMQPDGSSGLRPNGEGIPNIDVVKATIRAYYNAVDGVADKESSPYITEMTALTRRISPVLDRACRVTDRRHWRPAIVLDADDTTLWTYDMEDAAMHFTFDPALQDVWVQEQRFPATPGMVALVNAAHDAGCTLVGITGRNDDQREATLGNLQKVGYEGFEERTYYTKWTGVGDSQQPGYVDCAAVKCTTIEYKSQTRAHVESKAGGRYRILANFGDQFSDLLGGHAIAPVKLPNPTYYLP